MNESNPSELIPLHQSFRQAPDQRNDAKRRERPSQHLIGVLIHSSWPRAYLVVVVVLYSKIIASTIIIVQCGMTIVIKKIVVMKVTLSKA